MVLSADRVLLITSAKNWEISGVQLCVLQLSYIRSNGAGSGTLARHNGYTKSMNILVKHCLLLTPDSVQKTRVLPRVKKSAAMPGKNFTPE